MFSPPSIRSSHHVQCRRLALFSVLSAVLLFARGQGHAADALEKITYQDHVLPVIENNCAKCHNPDKRKGDLDLTTYNGALKGGGSGVVLVSGNLEASKLWKAVTHAEDPNMPPNKSALPDKELDVFKRWIQGG